MRTFRSQLADRLPSSRTPRRWIYVPYDQLSSDIGPLARWKPSDCGIILVESPWKAQRRPYHKRKLALVLANMRHFALEQAERGVDVRYVVHDGPYREALARVAQDVGPIVCMEPAERELRNDLEPLVSSGTLAFENHEGWLTARSDFEALGRPPWRMDRFYKNVRKRLGVLMDGNEPVGGAWSFDRDNRKPWKGTPPAPTPPTFAIDAIKLEVGELIETRFAHHPGALDLETLPATAADASRALDHAMEHCMASFGPFEDAMSIESMELFHTR
ncbi:MAG: cryptochrome/photolyase family protein, partial [Planctomycetes bacterium]|nr:cryptochrome/photolyase family protein [Planctomycetota bacterium]